MRKGEYILEALVPDLPQVLAAVLHKLLEVVDRLDAALLGVP